MSMSLKRSCAGTECLNSLMSGIELGSITVVVCLYSYRSLAGQAANR